MLQKERDEALRLLERERRVDDGWADGRTTREALDEVVKRLAGDSELCAKLCQVLGNHCGERGQSEGAVETLERLIKERDYAREHAAELERALGWRDRPARSEQEALRKLDRLIDLRLR